jgi:hypothetical protein
MKLSPEVIQRRLPRHVLKDGHTNPLDLNLLEKVAFAWYKMAERRRNPIREGHYRVYHIDVSIYLSVAEQETGSNRMPGRGTLPIPGLGPNGLVDTRVDRPRIQAYAPVARLCRIETEAQNTTSLPRDRAVVRGAHPCLLPGGGV